MPITTQRLILGDVNFFHFEVPETLPNLFGVQKLAIHDFPGGGRTVQELGSFPFPEIEWRGEFWDNDPKMGTTALQRADQLNTYRVSAETITLVWGPFQMDVIICEFEIIGMLKQRLGYRIKVVPIQDFTSTSNVATPSVPPATQVQNANQAVANATTNTNSGFEFSTDVVSQSQSITTNVNQAVQNANGNITNIPQSTVSSIQGQISTLQDTLTPLQNSTDFAGSAAANDLSGNLNQLNNAISSANPNIASITVSNPNLVVLSSQYYGTPDNWQLIAQANNLQDFQLTGTYSLVIPAANTQSQFIPDNAT